MERKAFPIEDNFKNSNGNCPSEHNADEDVKNASIKLNSFAFTIIGSLNIKAQIKINIKKYKNKLRCVILIKFFKIIKRKNL